MKTDVWRDPLNPPNMPVGRVQSLYRDFCRYMEHREGRTTPDTRRHITGWMITRTKKAPELLPFIEAFLDTVMDADLGSGWCFRYGYLLCSLLAQPDNSRFTYTWDGSFGVWGVIHVDDVVHACSRKHVYDAVMHVITGPAAGTVLSSCYPRAYLTGLLRQCGWDPPVYREPMAVELGGMLFGAWLRTDEQGRVVFESVHTQPAHRRHNKELFDIRGGPCTGPAEAQSCGYCRFGRADCPKSMHRDTYPIRMCRNTSVTHTGPCSPAGWCISCLERGVVDEYYRKSRDS